MKFTRRFEKTLGTAYGEVILLSTRQIQHLLKIGIIVGSGLNNPEFLTDKKMVEVTTEFGSPSDVLFEGHINQIPCVLLARHGWDHRIMPSNVNYRANLLALKKLFCTHVIASTACGSLKEDIEPGHLVVLDQFIDRTTKRPYTFYDGTVSSFEGILHLPMDTPFCDRTREILYQSCLSLEYPVHRSGTAVTVEGPRFGTRAESKLFRQWGCDIVNMTTVPEVVLARELGMCYAAIALVTDYDCWKDNEVVDVSKVMGTIKLNAGKAINVFQKAVKTIANEDWNSTIFEMKNNVRNNIMLPK